MRKEFERSRSFDWSSYSRNIQGSRSNIHRDRLVSSDQILHRTSLYSSANSIQPSPFYSRSSSITSQYVTNTFTATCVIVMIACFSILVLLALFAGSQEISQTGGLISKGQSDRTPNFKAKNIATETDCNVEIVESLPKMLIYPSNSTLNKATFDAWVEILQDPVDKSSSNVHIASAYWTLRPIDMVPPTYLPEARQGEIIFERLMEIAKSETSFLTIVDSVPFSSSESKGNDTKDLAENGATVRYINMKQLVGAGILHTKLIINNYDSLYLGSANMDWRSLTLVKELGLHFTHCPTIANDLMKIFTSYFITALPDSKVPPEWPSELSTKFNMDNPLNVKLSGIPSQIYFSASPPEFQTTGRTGDLDAVLDVIDKATEFIHIAVMDFVPGFLYSYPFKYWPVINDKLITRAINDRIKVKLLISDWQYTPYEQRIFLLSLNEIKNISGIEIKQFKFPPPSGPYVDHTLVNHNKYMVTDNCAYVGTNNWSADYFTNTGGIGAIINQTEAQIAQPGLNTIQRQLAEVFTRDWQSQYAEDLTIVNIDFGY